MGYPSLFVAKYFLKKAPSLKDDIMKILKLVYISHGYYLAITDKELIKEDVQAWQYGPVIPELYFRLKTDNIDPCYDLDFNDDDYNNFSNDIHIQKLLDAVYNKYKQFTGIQLSKLTHQRDTPWDITVNRFESKISNDLIKNHYKKILGL